MRWPGRRPRAPLRLEPLADGVPRRGLFAEPLRIELLDHERTESEGDGIVLTLVVGLRDAEGRRVPDIAIEAVVTTPERRATAVGTTDLMGRLRVRTRGPAGRYRLEVTDVAAGGLAWDPSAGPRELELDVTGTGATPADHTR
jgi:hypothetical protein